MPYQFPFLSFRHLAKRGRGICCWQYQCPLRALGLLPKLLLCSLLLATTLALAQDASTGATRGTVSDTAGARIRDCTIAAVNVATGLRYFATSDAEGRFSLPLLPPGDYMARAESAGMSPQVTAKFCVDLGSATQFDFKLTVAG